MKNLEIEKHPEVKFISDKKVAERYGIARSSVWNLVKKAQLPPPTKISDNITRWSVDALDAHDAKYV